MNLDEIADLNTFDQNEQLERLPSKFADLSADIEHRETPADLLKKEKIKSVL